MEDIQLLSMNADIENPYNLKPFHQLPKRLFIPLPEDEARQIKAKLSLPVQIA